jgi:molecular chaperone HtpG
VEEKVSETKFESKKKEKKKKVPAVEHQWELVNENKALWTHPQNEITDDEYGEFYKVLTNDYEKHLALKHFRTQTIFVSSFYFVSKHAHHDLFEPKKKLNNIKLYV